jgi:hypothetical protein
MHNLPGHVFFQDYRDINSVFDPASPTSKRAMDLWRMLARRYKGKKLVFEILNEPIARDSALWNDFARKIHAVIRSEAPDQWIMVSSNDWGHVNTFSRLSLIEDARTVYTFHFYEPLLFTHQNAPWVSFMKMLEGIKVPYPGPFDHSILDIKTGFPMDFGFMKKAHLTDANFSSPFWNPSFNSRTKTKFPCIAANSGRSPGRPMTTASVGTGTWSICLSNTGSALQTGTTKAMISEL